MIRVQTPSLVIRQGDFVYVDLMLGNHGNDHRDFKLAVEKRLLHVRSSSSLPML